MTMEMEMNGIAFDDVYIDTQYSDVESRSMVDLTSKMRGFELKLPVISANMPNITEWKMAKEMAINGGMGILHRFYHTIEENVDDFSKAVGEICVVRGVKSQEAIKTLGVSIGVKDSEKARFDALYEAGARIFCIDVNHGHSKMMKEMINWIYNQSRYHKTRPTKARPTIIAGNIATARAALDLAEWGADILKVGIGPGKVCRTRSNTGVGKPQFSAIKEVYDAIHGITNVKIIADGGIKTTGDIAKALIFADAVMVGAVLAGTSETPGDAFPEPGTDLTNRSFYKVYGGSASMENKVKNGQRARFVEGEMLKIPFKGHAKYLLREIQDGLQGSFSLSGCRNLREYKEKVKWYTMSGAGSKESKL